MLSKIDVFHDVPVLSKWGTKAMSIRIVKRYSLDQPNVQYMLHLYSDGVPLYIICQEFLIHTRTLRRLINQHEKEKGPLRIKKILRYPKQ